MTVYDLYLESGPRIRKTMVHVLDLLGCVAVGRTTEEAIDAAPDAIVAYLDFLQRCGERSAGAKDERGAIESRVAQHITEGKWLGNGSPYLIFASDFDPVEDQEIELFLRRFHQLRSELASGLVRSHPPNSTPKRKPAGDPPEPFCSTCSRHRAVCFPPHSTESAASPASNASPNVVSYPSTKRCSRSSNWPPPVSAKPLPKSAAA